MASEIEAITAACVRECVRQGVGLRQVAGLVVAYDYAIENRGTLPTLFDQEMVAKYVEPRAAARYRLTPVTFASGGSAAHWQDIPDAMIRMFDALDGDVDPAEFVRAFLTIHPYADGNGRTAFVLYNWLAGTLSEPQPLPDLFD